MVFELDDLVSGVRVDVDSMVQGSSVVVRVRADVWGQGWEFFEGQVKGEGHGVRTGSYHRWFG